MKATWLLLLILLCPVFAAGQARTAENIVSVPHSQLDSSARNGSVRYVINGQEGTTPCAAGGTGALAVKINGVWECPKLTPGVGTGDMLGPPASAVGELMVYGSTNGKNAGRTNTLNGIPLLTSGVVSALSTTGAGAVVRDTGATLDTPTLLTPSIASFAGAQHTHTGAAGGGQLNASTVFSTGTIPPDRIISNGVVNARCLRVNNVGQIEVAASDCGAGGGGTPGGVSGNLTFNEFGAFGGLGNTSYDATTGRLTLTQKANSNDTLNLLRFTDSSPTGTLFRARNAGNTTDLFVVNADGSLYMSSAVTLKTIAAPSTPSAGNTVVWADTTTKNLRAQDDAGNVSGTVRAITCSGTDKISSISSAGVPVCTADQGGAGTGVITLNTLTTSDQSFVAVDDTNIDLSVVSAVSAHTFSVAWVGTLSKARQHSATMYSDQGNTITTGAQSFAGATSLTVPSAAGAAPTASGQIAYDTTADTLEAGINGTNRVVAFTQGSQTFTDKTLDSSTTANLRDTLLTLQDNTDPTKTANFELSSIASGTNRVVTIANGASVTVQPSTLTTSQWVTHIDSAGVQQKAQPTLSDFSGTVPAVRGGTDQTSVAQGDLLFGSGSNVWSRLAKSTSATRYLANTGASNNPQWDQVNLANGVTGTLGDGNLSANVTLLGSSIDLSGAEATGVLAAGRFPALTGDVTTPSGSLATTIATDAVTNTKLANMATATFKGRTTAGTGDPEDLTATQATALLNVASVTLKGLVPPPGTSSGAFLRDDLTWVIPPGAGDMVLASVQTVTGAKTFSAQKLIIGTAASPTVVANAFFRDSGDGKLYIGSNDGTQNREIFVSGESQVNLASANVTGTLPFANGGTNQTTWTASRCVQVNSAGTALESASAACGSGGGSGTVTVVSSGSLTSTALVTGGGTTTLQTPSATSTLDSSGNMSLPGSLALTGSGAGFTELAEGTAPSAVANRVTVAAPTDVTAGGWVLSLPTTAGTSGQFLQTNGSGVTTWATPGGSGTVTATAGSLTANSVVLGAGTTDTKVVAGIITDGTSKLTLGVAGTSVGSIDLKNATSGTITLAPVTGALGTVTLSLPARTATIATTTGTLTSGRCVEIDASGNFIQAAAACGSGGGSGTVSSATTTQVAFYTGSTTVSGDAGMTYDSANDTLTLAGPLVTSGTSAGFVEMGEGTGQALVANRFQIVAPTDVAAAGLAFILPATAGTGNVKATNSSGIMTLSIDTTSYAPLVSPSFTTPSLGVATATSINGLTITTSTGTLTIPNGVVATGPAASDTLVGRASTDTLTNKTIDPEATGNAIGALSVLDFDGAGCSNTTAVSFWDLPTSIPAVPACVSGTNTQKAYLDFPDTSGGFSAQTKFRLPADFTGTVDAKITWLTTATSGNVKWSLSTICVATDATETDDPAFNTASTVTTAAPGVASRLQTSGITSLTITGCAAGELMHVRIFRDGNDAADTISATARLVGVQLVVRRTQ